MSPSAQGARAILPLAVIFALSVVAQTAPGAGLLGGALLGAASIMHALIAGASAAQRAVPWIVWRWLIALAVFALVACACAPEFAGARAVTEASLAAIAAGTIAQIFIALASRAPALPPES